MHIGIKTGYGYALALLIGMPMLLPGTLEAADNLSFRGVLVADACTLRPGGLLALDSGSSATGVAIGIETPADRPLPLNTASDEQVLAYGNNTIALKAYIRGEPQAIANQSIAAGTFRATSTFTLHYP